MPDAYDSFDRPGLTPRERILTTAIAAIAPADWTTLQACVDAAQQHGVPRGELTELLLQATLFFGFPRTVTAFATLVDRWPETTTPDANSIPHAAQRSSGEELFAGIYGDNTDAVHAMLQGYHPEFHDFVLESAYGRILSRPGLDVRMRELCAVAALGALEQIPQLVAHARGALKFGASEVNVRAVLDDVCEEDAHALMARVVRR